jgi:hypothetical protein
VNQQGAEVDIPALGDPTQSPCVHTGMLPGYHPQPRYKLAPVLEGAGIADRRHQGRGGHGPHTWNLQQPLRGFSVAGQQFQPAITGGDPDPTPAGGRPAP